MTLKQIAALGRELARFLALFAGCFRSCAGFALLQLYVQGLLSDVQRKNAEAIALRFGKAPRTLQRFLESIKWDESQLRNDCQRLVAREHADPNAIGCVDESGTAKSGSHTVAVARQWLGSCGKVENGVVGVHLSYATPRFQCLLDSELYLPEEWADDPQRRKKTTCPTTSSSEPSRRSPWLSSTGRWATACAWRRGRSTNCTGATADSSMAWSSVTKCSWPKCRSTFTAGFANPRCCATARSHAADDIDNTRAPPGGVRRAKCGTC